LASNFFIDNLGPVDLTRKNINKARFYHKKNNMLYIYHNGDGKQLMQKHYLKPLIIGLLVFTTTSTILNAVEVSTASVNSAIWQQVPIRSEDQKINNLAGGEGMQMIWGLSYAPSNANILYLLSDTSQIWKSDNGGQSWHMKHNGFLANGGVSLAVSPFNENFVLVAASVQESENNSDSLADGIYRTIDGGESWQLVKQTAFFTLNGDKGGVNFAFIPEPESQTIYAGTHNQGLLRSTDNGDSWESLDILTDTLILDIQINPHNHSLIYLATKTGLFSYHTQLKSLTQLDTSLADFPRAIVFHPELPEVLFISAGTAGVLKSTDGGASFKNLQVPRYEGSATTSAGALDPSPGSNVIVTAVGGRQQIIAVSENAGISWSLKEETRDEHKFIAFHPQHTDTIYAGNWLAYRGHSNGIFRSIDSGETWENISSNLGPEFTPWAISINPYNGYVYMGSSHGTWRLISCSPSANASFSMATGKLDLLARVTDMEPTENNSYEVGLQLVDADSWTFSLSNLFPTSNIKQFSIATYSPENQVLNIPKLSVISTPDCSSNYSATLVWETQNNKGVFKLLKVQQTH